MNSEHAHAIPVNQNERSLWWVLGLTSNFLLAEVVAGVSLNSLAWLADGIRTCGNHRFEAEGKAFDPELVSKPDLIAVYLSDHSTPMLAKGAKGKVMLLTATDKLDAELVAVGDIKLEAKGWANVASGTKAVVVTTPEGKPASRFRYTIK